jgi:ribosomal protein L21
MNNPEDRINRELAPEVFQLAAELYAQKQQEYSLEELIIIGEEAKIPAEFIQQAVDLVQTRQQKNRKIKISKKYPKLKLALLGCAVTSVTLILGAWGYNQIFINKSKSDSPVGILPGEQEKRHIGNVERYLLNKEGLVDGLLLNDDKHVKFPPHLHDQILAAIKPGDTVEVVGKLGTPSVYGQEIEASIITNTQTKAVVTKKGKPKRKQKVNENNLTLIKIDDTVQHWLVDDDGKIRGAILTSGTQVHLAKPLAKQLEKVTKIGNRIKADGVGRQTTNGEVVEVISLDIDGQVLPPSQN